ncbi:neutral amino acid permease [Colletotrichum truncatum]|uniref:Neutral amino acid permease n=1 Tax=Colletotrichum truncatum TaxID=5467 RepID=A0ACC3ZG15_COLTU|nr:neutral amino acid permease [Colletotrichum truncatum]KAF6801952.1 neutral amino acid permease [Colletotrichum truncatum]
MTVAVSKPTVVAVAATTVTPVDEIAVIWQEVQRMVIRMAGGDASKINKQLDIDGVMQYLEQVQVSDQKAAEKHGTVKKVFNRTLQCISKVGGIIADGASNVFGPANTCFNALTFVIGAWQSYSAAFESLAALLEKCAEFFERLPYYDIMDASLKKVACCQLKLFVDVCDKALQLKRKRRKFEMFLRHMFLEDDDIKDLLGQMEKLTAREHGLVSAQTYKISQDAAQASQEAAKTSKESAVKLDTLVEQTTAHKKEKTEQKFKDKVQEAFFGKNAKDAVDKWEAPLRKYKSDLIDGTGEWLDDEQLFISWMTGDDTTDPILGIEGNEGSGKTRVAAHIISRLQKQKTVGGSNTRCAVAYYFLETDSKEDTTAAFRKKQVAGRISKSLLWQLTQAEQPFLKSVAGLCDKVKTDDPADIWQQLLLENEDRVNIESTFFIVLDGLGENLDGLISLFKKLSEDPARIRTRVLVTGNESAFEQLEKEEGIRMKKMTLGTRNSKDVELYIEARMNDMEILRDTSRPGVLDTKKMVLEKLLSSTNGDYYITSAALDNIDRVDSLEEVEDCLEKASGARSNQILEDIKRLNFTMKPKEIEEINEIILWIKWGIRWVTPAHVETSLEMKADPESASRQTSLRSLESKIKSKYSSLFRLDGETIDFKIDEMRDNIPTHNNADPILPEELNIVKHYLSTVCPRDVYEKFGFNDFFEQKMERKKNYICQDPNNAEITLAIRCLRCLVDEQQTAKNRQFRTYASEYVYQHLENADISLADRELKAQAGSLLVRLFTEEAAIEALLTRDYGLDWEHMSAESDKALPSNWAPWVFSDSGKDLFRKWSQDSSVLEYLEDKNALKVLASNDDYSNSWFETAANLTAKRLLKPVDRGRELEDAFTLLLGLIKRLSQTDEERKQEFKIDEERLWLPTMEDFSTVETWALKSLGLEADDAVWQTTMVKLLNFLENDVTITPKDTETRARRTLETYPDDWVTLFLLARGLESNSESIEMLERLIEQLKDIKDDPVWRSDKENLAIYSDVIESLGDRYWNLPGDESAQKAAQLYLSALDESHTWVVNYAGIIAVSFSRRQLSRQTIEYCEKLLSLYEDGMTVAAKVVYQGSKIYMKIFWDAIKNACLETDRWDILTELWKEGVKKSESPPRDPYWTAQINKWYQICMAHRPGYDNAGIGVIEASLREDWVKDGGGMNLNDFACFILPVYTKRAFREESSPETRGIYVEKAMALNELFKGDVIRYTETALRFARFFHLKGDHKTAKSLLRDEVSQMLEMLSDDDVENDRDSFRVLSEIFVATNDIANMIACWEMMSVSKMAEMAEYERKLAEWEKATGEAVEGDADHDDISNTDGTLAEQTASPEEPISEQQEPTSEDKEEPVAREGSSHPEDESSSDPANIAENETSVPDVSPQETDNAILIKPQMPDTSLGICFTYCDTVLQFPNKIWVCLDCVGQIWLDEDCFAKFGPKGVKNISCGADHTFIQLPPCDEASIKAIPSGSIRVDGKIITMEDWKASVKATYVDDVEIATV